MITIEQVPPDPHPVLTVIEQWRIAVDNVDRGRMCVSDVAGDHYVSFDMHEVPAAYGVRVVLRMRTWLRERTRPVLSLVDVERFPRAERLDGLLGFQPTDATVELPCGRRMRVWKWQISKR